MRTLLVSLVVIATATAAAATALYSTGSSHRPLVKPIAVPDFEYRFYDRFCRAQYNNPTDRNACMMQATGTPPAACDTGPPPSPTEQALQRRFEMECRPQNSLGYEAVNPYYGSRG